MPGGGIATLQKKSTRSKTGDGQDSSLVRKTSARKSTKSVPASDDPINLEPVAAETPASSVGDELDRIASGNAVLAMEEVGTETFQPTPVEEPQYCPRLLSAADRANLDHKYGRRGSQIALDVLIGKVTSQQTVALENLFFHTARVFKFQLGEKKFFINLVQDSSGSNSGRVQISLSCDKGTIQVCLDSLDDLAAFAPELSNFSIGSYPAPVQDMLLNSLLSPLWDRLSTLLAAKVACVWQKRRKVPLETNFPSPCACTTTPPTRGRKSACCFPPG
jgi:hypothetical protein